MRYELRPRAYCKGAVGTACALALLAGCRPPSGLGPIGAPARAAPALERLGAAEEPSLGRALRGERADLLAALDRSLAWFEKPSSRQYFRPGAVSHERAWASVRAFRALVSSVADPGELERRIRREFEFYASVGADGRGTVLFTGYYSPTFDASRTQRGEYRYPLYGLPDDAVVNGASGAVERRVDGRVGPYPTRAEIERLDLLRGLELAWLRDPFDVYLTHVQGSAALSLTDGSVLHVGYAGNNGHEYVSVARALVEDGKLKEDELSLENVRGYFEARPGEVERYLRRNPRFVFFRLDDGSNWPLGSLGAKVTPLRTLATDKAVFPPGGVTLVVTQARDVDGRVRPFEQLMLDQDSGGAIRSPGRADIYFGLGPEAEQRAGGQHAEGRLYYLFLKGDRVEAWRAGDRPGDRRGLGK